MSLQITAKAAGNGYLHEPEEWLPGTIEWIEETENEFGEGLKWIIELDGDEPAENGDARQTWAFSSKVLSPKSKLWAWATALGYPVTVGYNLDLQPSIGQRVDVFFERHTGTSPEGQPVDKERVTKIRASKTAAPTTTKPARRVVADDDDAPF